MSPDEAAPSPGRHRSPTGLDPALLAILVCPLTRTPLRYEAQELVSDAAGLAYPVRDGTPIMIPEHARVLDEGESATRPPES